MAPLAMPSIARIAAISPFIAWPLRLVLPLAVDQVHQHEAALVDAVALARLEGVDGVRAHEVLGTEDRVLERHAELRRAGLGSGHRPLGGVEEDEPGIEGVGGEAVGGRYAVGLLIGGTE